MHFFNFRQWPIFPKILMTSVVSISCITAVILFYFVPLIEHKMLQGKKDEVKNVVDIAFGIFLEYDTLVKKGQMRMLDAQERVSERIRSLRYNENEYFWINDVRLKMIMHPNSPELNGRDLSNYRDPNGKLIFREFVSVCKAKGSGFVQYMWPKPGENNPVPKISYVKVYEPWGWIVGSGIYVDDVKRDMSQLRFGLLAGILPFIMVTITFASMIGAGITRPLKKVISGLHEIARGNGYLPLTRQTPIPPTDEVDLLSDEFNSLMESISNLTIFKKVIEEDDSSEAVYFHLGEVFTRQLGFDDCLIYEISGGTSAMNRVYPISSEGKGSFCNPEIMGNGDLCKAKKTGHVISSLAFPSVCMQFHDLPSKAHYCIPLVVGGGTLGIAQLVFDQPAGQLAAKEHEMRIFKAEQYINESLPVIETKRLMNTLWETSLRDPLTGLHNRRYLQEYSEKIVAGIVRRGRKIGLIMCDLDNFKQVNDAHGHHAGDMLLKKTALALQQSVREADIVIRFGGEEFLVVLLDISDKESIHVAEKIRTAVQDSTIRLPDSLVSRTITLGVSEFPSDSSSFWHCIKLADMALYKGKEMGRNRVVSFEKEKWDPL